MEGILFKIAFIVPFFGTFNVSKLVLQAAMNRSRQAIELLNIQLSPSALLLCLRYSKTDQNGKEALVMLW